MTENTSLKRKKKEKTDDKSENSTTSPDRAKNQFIFTEIARGDWVIGWPIGKLWISNNCFTTVDLLSYAEGRVGQLVTN